MKYIALAGNPNSGKTTLFNSLTGLTAHVGNWPGVTVDKKEGLYKKFDEELNIIDLPGIYSLSPYTSEEVISRNYIIDEKPDCIINVVDATNLERNLYLTTQLMEMDVPLVVALNMMDLVEQNGGKIDAKELSKNLGIPVVCVSAQKEEHLDELMKVVYEETNKKRKGKTVLSESKLSHIINDCKTVFTGLNVENPLFHAVKLVEMDELEVKDHPQLVKIVDEFKKVFNDDIFGSDLEAIIADARYKYITSNYSICKTVKERKDNKDLTKSDKIDKVMTHKWFGIPIFFIILFLIFHLTFSENFLFLGGLFENVDPSFAGTPFEGLLWTNGGINSPGFILFSLVDSLTSLISDTVAGWLEIAQAEAWVSGLLVDGILGGLFGVISFLPQILVLFLFFSILEDTGYMARVAFILDRALRRFGVSGRALMPMIMGFGCSVPAMINTRTLAEENERLATIRVIPFFSCGAKLPILTAIAGGIIQVFGFGNADIITFSMYLFGMALALITLLIMRKTTMKGKTAPFIMELPNYHMPKFKSLMLHLWDKLKHFIKKAFTIILASTIVIWFLTNFGWDWSYLGPEGMQNSILASLGKLLQPIFTPLGFGSQLGQYGWVFAVAAVTGLIAKENVIATFFTLACCLVTAITKNPAFELDPDLLASILELIESGEQSDSGVLEVAAMIGATGITWQGLISFIVFNMTTIPCFAAVATAKAELPQTKFGGTLVFWIFTSYIASSVVFVSLTALWTIPIFIAAAILLGFLIYLFNRISIKKEGK